MGLLSAQLTTISFGASGSVTLGLGGPGLESSAEFRAPRVWNAVWNDLADFQLLCDKLEYGKCYYDTKDGARICSERCQMSVIGIASDTFGFGVGSTENRTEVPIAVAGWVLAFVDKEYECGTPLTNDANGNLTAMTREEKMEYPERIVAIYKRKEMEQMWGPEGKKIEVKGRHWVKVK